MDTCFVTKLHLAASLPESRNLSLYETHSKNNRLTAIEAERMRQKSEKFGYRPLISLLVPVHDAKPDWLDRLTRSVLAQTYDRWELVFVDDGSESSQTREALDRITESDERIVLERLQSHQGISGATNRGAELSHGEFLGFVDHDDELLPDALWWIVLHFQHDADCDVLYTDEELVHEDGTLQAYFKPDFSPELLTAYNYFCHLLVIRRTLFELLDGLRPETDGAQDYDLVLRAIGHSRRIAHIPRVLYRWHIVEHSTSRFVDPKTKELCQHQRIDAVTQKVVQEYLDRMGARARAVVVDRWVRPEFEPVDRGKVSILICTRDHPWLLWSAVRSVKRRTNYPNYEIVIVDDSSRSLWARLMFWWLSRTRNSECGTRNLRILHHSAFRVPHSAFNYARLNNEAALKVDGKFLLFLNDDTKVLSRGWLSAMVGYLGLPEVGAVGARLLFENRTIQHAGVILGAMGWGPWHALQGQPADTNKHGGYLTFPHNAIAVTGACLLTPRDLFLQLGGFDDEKFAVNYNDTDYCLRLHHKGYRTAYVPQAELIHYGNRSRGPTIDSAEAMNLRKKTLGFDDPYWNPNWSRQSPDFAVGTRRRSRGLRKDLVPHVLVIGRAPKAGDPWPGWSVLFPELCERGRCTFVSYPLDSAEAKEDRDLRDRIQNGRFDVVFAQGQEMAWAIEQAHQTHVPSIWYLPEQLLLSRMRISECGLRNGELEGGRGKGEGGREEVDSKFPSAFRLPPSAFVPSAIRNPHSEFEEYLRVLTALRWPYQVVFNNLVSQGWAAFGVPHDNMSVLEAVLIGWGDGNELQRLDSRRKARDRLRKAMGVDPGAVVLLADATRAGEEELEVFLDAYFLLGRQGRRMTVLWVVVKEPKKLNVRIHRRIARFGRQVELIEHEGLGVETESFDPSYYAAADLFLCHATDDARPLSALLALHHGLPVVGTTRLERADLIHVGRTGLSFRPFRPKELARKIRWLLVNSQIRRSFGNQSADWLQSRANPDMVLEEWADLLLEAAESKPWDCGFFGSGQRSAVSSQQQSLSLHPSSLPM